MALVMFAALALPVPQLVARPVDDVRPERRVRSAPRSALTFIENRGQWGSETRFSSVFGRAVLRAERGAITVGLIDRKSDHGHVLRVRFDEPAEPEGLAPVGELFHFLGGEDPARWRRFLPGFGGLRFESATPSVDVIVEGLPSGARWSAVAASSAALQEFGLHVEGLAGAETRADGSVVVPTAAGHVTWAAPELRNQGLGPARPGRWSLSDGRLVVTPPSDSVDGLLTATSIDWATYFGANGSEFFQGVAEHDDGSVGAAGYTLSNMIPVTPGAFQPTQSSDGDETGFVTRFSADGGALIYATFLGGSVWDEVEAVCPGEDGELLVAGFTLSEDFPTTPGAFDEDRDPFSSDAFLSKLTGDGSSLVFSTYFGGQVPDTLPPGTSGIDGATGIALDSAGNIILLGYTGDAFLPGTAGSFQPALADAPSPQDAFVARFSPDGAALLGATYLGGGATPPLATGAEHPAGLAVLPDDSIVVVGRTTSPLFPTTPHAFQPDPPSDANGFVARLSPDLSSLVFGSYLGGDGWDEARAVGSLPDGGIVVAGKVESMFQFGTEYDFPITPDAFDPVPGGPSEGFLVHIAPDGSRLRYSTYFGGSGRDDWPMSMVVDRAGGVTVACQTSSFDAAVTPGALQSENHTSSNDATAYIARFHPDRSLLYGTYLGGTTWDVGKGADRLGLAVGDLGDLLIAQGTFSDDFPLTAGSPFPEKQLKVDGFLASLTMLPAGVTRYGTSTPGATGRLALGALAMPRVGADGFGFSCTGAPANAPGFLVLSMDALDSPASVGGAALWVDPARLLGVLPVVANAHGYAQRRVAIPSDPAIAGFTAHAQFLWPGAGVATHASATAAARVVVQR